VVGINDQVLGRITGLCHTFVEPQKKDKNEKEQIFNGRLKSTG